MLYLISDVVKIQKEAFRKALKDVRIMCSGFSIIEIKKMIGQKSIATLQAYINGEIFRLNKKIKKFLKKPIDKKINTCYFNINRKHNFKI